MTYTLDQPTQPDPAGAGVPATSPSTTTLVGVDGQQAPYDHSHAPYPPVMYATPQPDRFTAFWLRLYQRSPKWAAPAAVALCFAGAATYTLVSDPTDADASSLPSCLVKLTTGFDCPGCGGTRAFFYLLHGNLPAAARHHALAVFAAPFLVYLYLAWTVQQITGRRLPQLRVTPVMLSSFLAVWGVFSILRNLPFAPFTWFFV